METFEFHLMARHMRDLVNLMVDHFLQTFVVVPFHFLYIYIGRTYMEVSCVVKITGKRDEFFVLNPIFYEMKWNDL